MNSLQNSYSTLLNLAIKATKQSNWAEAIELNTQILADNPKDTKALNRLAIAYLQLGKKKEAKQTFQQVIGIDGSNLIAKKNLDKINNNETVHVPNIGRENFIEEPGKTKTTELKRLASKTLLVQLTVGQECTLKPKNRYISVEIDGQYVGALPEDISFRLTKLMESGNTYRCRIHSVDTNTCGVTVFIKEVFRSEENMHMNSFPINRATNPISITGLDESYEYDEIPLALVNTDDSDEDEPISSLTQLNAIEDDEREV